MNLLEQLLLEYDHEITLNKFKDKLLDRAKKDRTARLFAQDADAILSKIELGDPTDHKEYTPWLVKTYINDSVPIEDVISNYGDELLKYNQLKKRGFLKQDPTVRDINTIKSFDALGYAVSKHADKLNAKTKKEKEAEVDKGDYKIWYRDDMFTVVEMKDAKAAQYFGQDTTWCTATTNNNMFNHYHSQGPLYAILPRKPKMVPRPSGITKPPLERREKYQLHYASGQVKDVFDEPVGPSGLGFSTLLRTYPQLIPILRAIPDFQHLHQLADSETSKKAREAKEKQEQERTEAMMAFISSLQAEAK